MELPDYIYITGYEYDVAPAIEPYQTDIPYRLGNVDGGIKRGNLTHTFDLTIDATIFHTPFRVRQDLKRFIRGNDWEVSRLESSEWEGRYVNARVATSPNVQDLIVHGTTSIEFVSTDPVYYSNEQSSIDLQDYVEVYYVGLEKAPTIVSVVPDKDVKQLKVTNETTGDFVRLQKDVKKGNEVIIDSDRKYVSYRGKEEPELFALESKWLYLSEGVNKITVTDKDDKEITGETTLKYTAVD